MKKFEAPDIKVERFSFVDILTASGEKKSGNLYKEVVEDYEKESGLTWVVDKPEIR